MLLKSKCATSKMSQKLSIVLLTLLVCASIIFYFIYQTYTVKVPQIVIPSQTYTVKTPQITTVADIVENCTNNSNIYSFYSYRDLDAQLCRNLVDWPNKTSYKLTEKQCPKKGIISVVSGGRTGNQLWEYASLWAVARLSGLNAYVPACIKKTLDNIFEHISIPAFDEIADCPVTFNRFVTSIDKWTSPNQSIILPRYAALHRLISPHLEDLMKEMKFIKQFRDKAQDTLEGFLNNLPAKNYTFVGVHVRRTDYIKYLKSEYKVDPVKPQFFTNAMNYYKGKYSNCLFIYISDDPIWCIKQFGQLDDVFIAANNTPAEDLALMGACNHSIFDYGTYGEWGSILAGGEAVTQDFRRSRMLPKWIRISQEPPNWL